MVRRIDLENNPDPVNRDERLGEAIERFLALSEEGAAPDVEAFSSRYPDLGDDLREALEGLALVRGLVGDAEGPGRRLESGRRVAGYRIVRELGRGGMGIVYEAVHVGLDRPVALKVLGTHAAPDSNGRRRFLNEARTAAGLHHTHIVPVFDVGQVGGLCYYAMQRIEGSGLDRVLRALRQERTTGAGSGSHKKGSKTVEKTQGRSVDPSRRLGGLSETGTWNGGAVAATIAHREIDPLALGSAGLDRDDEPPPFVPPRGANYYRWVAQVGRQAAEALGHAHLRGIIHRDVKPSNILIDARGTIWMADFGLARRLADPGLTQSDSLLGTPRYMSPEQAEPGPIDGRTDVYSLGATLYELLTLRPPFEGGSAAELVRQIVNREPAHPRTFDARIPRDLETIVLKALAKRPADRYPTALELAADLERFLHYEPVKARRISPLGRAWRFARRHPALTAVSLFASATIVSVATIAHVQVVHALDEALSQGKQKEAALAQARESERLRDEAERKRKPSMRSELLNIASDIRQTPGTDRVRRGLDAIRRAAELDPDNAAKVRLRDEAIEFLALRDVVREPELETGPVRAIAFSGVPSSRASRLAVLSESAAELDLWDPSTRELIARQDLRVPAGTADEPATPDSKRPGGSAELRGINDRLTSCLGLIAVIRPDNRGFRFLFVNDPLTAIDYRLPEWAEPGRELAAIHLASHNEGSKRYLRLITTERIRDASNSSPPADRSSNPSSGGRGKAHAHAFSVRLWDACDFINGQASPAPLATLFEGTVESIAGSRTPAVSVGPHGSTIAVARAGNPSSATFWNAENGAAKFAALKTTEPILAISLGPDGLLAVAEPGTIRLWDLGAESGPTALPSFTPRHNWPTAIRFSPDGAVLAVAGSDPGVELWDVVASTMVATLAPTDRGEAFAFSPGGRAVAVPSSRLEAVAHRQVDLLEPRGDRPAEARRVSSVSLWSIVEPFGRARLPESKTHLSALGFGPRDLLAIASWDGPIRFWSPESCPLTSASLAWKNVWPTSLAFDSAGRLLTMDSGGLRRIELGSALSKNRRVCPVGKPPEYWVDLPALGSDPAWPPVSARPAAPRPAVTVVARASAGRRMVLTRFQDAWLVDPSAAEPLRRLPPIDRERSRSRLGPPWWRNVFLSPAGDRIYLSNIRGDLQVLALSPTGDRVETVRWGSRFRDVTATALSPNGELLALGDRFGVVTLVKTLDGEELSKFPPPSSSSGDRVESLAFSPAGDLLAAGGFERVRLYRIAAKPNLNGEILRLPVHRGRVVLLAFNSDGRRLALGTDSPSAIDVWNLARVRDDLDNLKLGW